MLNRCHRVNAVAALVFAVPVLSLAQTVPHPQWVGTRATAPMLAEGGFNVRALTGVTLRETVHISAGGAEIRVRFTNAFGTGSAGREQCARGPERRQRGHSNRNRSRHYLRRSNNRQRSARRGALLRSHCVRRAAAL